LTGNGYDGILTNMTDSDWITSGAALGDNSIYDYTGSVASDFSVTLSHSDGDAFTAFGDSGTYTGLHVYLVTESPSSYTAPAGFSTLYTDHYFGVFPVGFNQTYSIDYYYTGHSEIVDDTNLRLVSRSNNAASWTDLSATLDTSSTTISKTGISAFTGLSTTEFIPGINVIPVIESITDQTTNEDTTISIPISITDTETATCSLSIAITSSDSSLISVGNITYTCSANTIYLSLTPSSNQSGYLSITVSVTNTGGQTSETSFGITVNSINDAPVIGSIAHQTTLEDIATSIISFTATDIETAASSLILTMTSSDQTLVPDEYLIYQSNAGEYSIVATPALNQYGTATISVTITDGDGLATSTSFNLTVTDVDDSLFYWTNFQAADVVLGQSNFTTTGSGLTDNSFDNPISVAVDPTTGKVFICDRDNSRILRFDSVNAAINGSSAEAVLGQANFTSGQANRGGSVAVNTLNLPIAIYVDSFGRLWTADRGNNRVLRFDNASSKSNGADADLVLGQPDFTTNSAGITQNKMNFPTSIWLDPGGRLWVADMNNNRVLRFDNAASKSNGANADGVLGQSNFISSSQGTSQSAFKEPYDIIGDTLGTIYIVEYANNRVLRFNNAAIKANGANADGVLGQSDFVSSVSTLSDTNMNACISAGIDHLNNLYVSDINNNRITIFNDVSNKANGAAADNVLGQPDLTSNTANNGGVSARTLSGTRWIYFNKSTQHLWVTDNGNHRVLRYSISVKTAPVISLISDPTMDEDTVSNSISFTVTDINEQALTITYISSDESIISSSGITFSGSQVSTNGSSYIV
ncbi:hypothetical protein MHK_010489, partial [Candidatus Magnetomorum sp. HK-1]